MKKKILLSLALVLLVSVVAALLVARELTHSMDFSENKTLQVLYGDSIYKVAQKLEQQDVLQYPRLWVWYARAMGKAEKIRAGEYQITAGSTPLTILDTLVKGDAIKYTFTMIEGWTVAKAIAELQRSDGIVITLDPKDQAVILKAVNADPAYQHSEGLFYPDTYQYTRGTKDWEILQKAYARMSAELEQSWSLRAQNLPYKTSYELLIMASIVEKESGVDKERKQIAGVFIQRMLMGMKLQTDPTVIYGMGDTYKGDIRKKDLLTPTPYNTYTIEGLPPTPISLVSKKSLNAAANPLVNGMIFFVAKGNGYHVFTKTLAEHEEAVRQYQLSRNADYRSTPEKCDGTRCEKTP